jgi:hypothetical protein
MQMRGGHLVPYHVVPGPAPDKRILLISYHAPPSNEVGALRWAGMAPHLAARGWGVDILALDPAALRSRNVALLGALPPGTRLFGIPDELPAFDRVVDRVVDLRRRVRAGLKVSVPPPAGAELASDSTRRPLTRRSVVNAFHAWREYAVGARWARRAAEAGRRIFVPGVHRWVASTAPPQMSHEGGRLLSVWTGLPFLADFRDPWRFSEWVSLGPAWLRLAERYEVPVVAQTTLTVVNVEPVRRIMQQAYPNARVVTITNGVDEAPIPAPPSGRRFIIGYPGGIYLGRDPAPVFEAVGMMVRELGLRPEQLGLEFMGFFEPHVEARLGQLAAAHGIEPFVAVHPGRPRPEALQFMTTCAVLVALQQGSDLAIPAKLFEYMRYPAWLLVVAGRDSATAQLLAGTTALVHDPADTAGIQAALTARFHEFQSGGRAAPLGNEERFTRRFQASLLLEAMEPSVAGRG